MIHPQYKPPIYIQEYDIVSKHKEFCKGPFDIDAKNCTASGKWHESKKMIIDGKIYLTDSNCVIHVKCIKENK